MDVLEETIEGWRGQPIVGVRSQGKSKTFYARDWRALVLDSKGAIAAKACEPAPRASGWFTPQGYELVCEADGRCSYLQSLQSEDTVTWAAFGSRTPEAAINTVLAIAFGSNAERPTSWPQSSRRFWERFEHPDTRKTYGGPEPDVVLDAPGWRYVVEAKWLADLDDSQGVDGKTNQLAMRLSVARSATDDSAKRGVLVIAPGPTRYRKRTTFSKYFAVEGESYKPLPAAIEIEARAVTWEQVTNAIETEIGSHAEIVQYLRWRIANIGE